MAWVSSAFTAICMVILMLPGLVHAGQVNSVSAPPGLSEWKGWVLYGEEGNFCPNAFNNPDERMCVWPSVLNISVDPAGGAFVQEWLVFTRSWVALPGNAENWPQGVTVNGKPHPAVDRDGVASILLPPGKHIVSGRFVWRAAPEMIPVPPQSGLVRLSISGRQVENPVLDADGNLWVERRASGKKEEDSLTIRVYRLIEDSVPMQMVTRVMLEVGGSAREISLPGLLLTDSMPLNLSSDLPARIAPDGSLSIQARPGRHELSVTSFFNSPVTSVGPSNNISGQEFWSFAPRNDLRMVRVSGLSSVDAGLAGVPDEWKGYAAYAVQKGSVMKLSELRRGDTEPPKNKLTLVRTLWLDFSGKGFTVHDEISGFMSRDWMLAMSPPYALGRVTLSSLQPGQSQEGFQNPATGNDLLITSQTARKIPGVELRRGTLSLSADSRIEGSLSRFSALGWDHDFDSIRTELRLPPGWKLFAALGPDRVSRSYVSDWNLFDFFITLLIIIAAFRLMGVRLAALLALFMVISHRENGSPLFIWLFLFASLALLKVLPQGGWLRFADRWRKFALIILALMAVGFVKDQLLLGFYPHLQYAHVSSGVLDVADLFSGPIGCGAQRRYEQHARMEAYDAMAVAQKDQMIQAPSESVKPAAAELESGMASSDGKYLSRMSASSVTMKSRYGRGEQKAQDLLNEPEALVQTGPGLPDWNFGSIYLNWTGSVEKSQKLTLFLCPPWLFRILCFLRVLLMALLLAFSFKGKGLLGRLRAFSTRIGPDGGNASGTSNGASVAMILALAVGLGLFSATETALASSAQEAEGQAGQSASIMQNISTSGNEAGRYPSKELLDEYRRRLIRPSDCFPACADCPAMEITVKPESLQLLLEIHAASSVAVPLPGGVKSWLASDVVVDGKPALGLSKDSSGVLWLFLPPGVHRVALLGGIADKSALTIPFPLKPRRVTVSSIGWEVFGISENGSMGASIDLSRLKKAGDKTQTVDENKLPAFLHVERVVSLERSWTVSTTVSRVSPKGVAAVIALPLLSGESVTEAGIPVEKGRAMVTLPPDAVSLTFSSALKISSEIILKAPKNTPWTETWVFNVSPIWHTVFSGLPVIRHQDQGVWQPMWKPWPGEALKASVSKPVPVAGKVLTIDRAILDWSAGDRLTRGVLNVSVRTSQGGQQAFTLPSGADLEKLLVNGTVQPVRLSGGRAMVALQAGKQEVTLEWTRPKSLGVFYSTDSAGLGAEAVNATVSLEPPKNRWILFAFGPSLGPAVLFYRYLALVVIFAILLGRLSGTPLKTLQWLLLGLGLTQTSSFMGLLVILWFVLLRLRGKTVPDAAQAVSFNFRQLILVLLTLAAFAGLWDATQTGLLGIPDMAVAGNGSHGGMLKWTADRIGGDMPQAGVIWLPMWVFRVLMLLWALWLAFSLVKWLRWGWNNFSRGGLWLKVQWRAKTDAAYEEAIRRIGSKGTAKIKEPASNPVETGKGEGGAKNEGE